MKLTLRPHTGDPRKYPNRVALEVDGELLANAVVSSDEGDIFVTITSDESATKLHAAVVQDLPGWLFSLDLPLSTTWRQYASTAELRPYSADLSFRFVPVLPCFSSAVSVEEYADTVLESLENGMDKDARPRLTHSGILRVDSKIARHLTVGENIRHFRDRLDAALDASPRLKRLDDTLGVSPNRLKPHQYDVCLSFAGEDREYVEKVAAAIKAAGRRVFYDGFEQAALWGANLYDHLSDIYQNQSQFCVMFISRAYANKLWTSHERQSAQARALRERAEYILPVRFDATVVPGLPDTIGYVDGILTTPEQLVALLLEKLERGAR